MTKGRQKTGGRKAGTPNKLTTTVKESVLETFHRLQEEKDHNLFEFAKKNLRDFYLISAKLIPTEISGKVQHTFDVLI